VIDDLRHGAGGRAAPKLPAVLCPAASGTDSGGSGGGGAAQPAAWWQAGCHTVIPIDHVLLESVSPGRGLHPQGLLYATQSSPAACRARHLHAAA